MKMSATTKAAVKASLLAVRDAFALLEAAKILADGGKCPESGCTKKVGDKWRVISNKTGKLWPAEYDTEQDAKDALAAYHMHASTVSAASPESDAFIKGLYDKVQKAKKALDEAHDFASDQAPDVTDSNEEQLFTEVKRSLDKASRDVLMLTHALEHGVWHTAPKRKAGVPPK